MPKEPSTTPPPRRRLSRWRWAFLLAASMMIIGASATVGVFIGYVRSLPPIERLEYYDPAEVSRVYDRGGTVNIGEFKNVRRQVASIDEIPVRLRQAFIAIEDSRFYRHFGVDVLGVVRAMVVNLRAGRIRQGASTITQQLTRNILPERVGFERKLVRKIKEAILAIQIERRYSKEQILEFYLNHIDFSSNSFGVQAASATYFSKRLGELTLAECALLAGIPKATTKYNPILHPESAHQRRDIVLRRMHALGMIDEALLAEALAEPLQIRPGLAATSRFPYFVDALRRDLCGYYELTPTTLKEGGLRITSTLDPAIQDACIKALTDPEVGLVRVERDWQKAKYARHLEEEKDWDGVLRAGETRLMKISAVESAALDVELHHYRGTLELPERLPYYEPERVIREGQWIDVKVESVDRATGAIEGELGDELPVQGSIVVLDARTGEILAMVGGTNFYDREMGGWWNRAIQGGRQAGSCFKPFFYAAAFAQGNGPNAVIVDEPVAYDIGLGREYKPINYEKRTFGPTTLIEALEHSRNIVTIRLFESMGLANGVDFVRRFDYIDAKAHWKIPREISTCLGTIDCTPLEMAAAYQVFANQGVGVRPQWVRSVVDPDGRIHVPLKRREKAILDPLTAYQVQYLLRQVVRRGTGRSQIGNHFPSPPAPPICGKTGTTNDCRDAWFCGFTPELVIVCQVGFDRPRPMGPRMTGGRVTGPIWRAAFEGILQSRNHWSMTFETPEEFEFANICARTGKRAGTYCEADDHNVYLNVPFRRGAAPGEMCDGSPSSPLIAPVGFEWDWLASRAAKVGFAYEPLPENNF